MSDDHNAGGAGDQNSGANSDKDGKGTVSYDTYSKVMDELKATQRDLKSLKDNQTKTNEEKLKEQNDWKTLAESRDAQLKELNEKFSSTEQAIHDSFKLSAFQKHLGGKLKSDKYFDFVETSKIAFDPETKKVDEASVKSVVAAFLKEHRDLVDFGKKPGMPNVANSGDKKVITDGTKTVEQMTPTELREHILNLAKKGLIK